MVLLRELGFTEVEGLEISPPFLEELRSKNLRAYYGNILSGDGLDQLLAPYDVVLMMEVLEHLEEPEAALRNVRALLADDGLLYLTVPICDSIFERVLRIKRRMSRQEQVRRIDETHIHAFSQEDLENILTRAGFAVREVRRLSFRVPRRLRFSKVFLLLRALLPNRFRGSNISIVAQPNRKQKYQ